MKYLFFVRHGETDGNKKGLVQGHTDCPLNQNGKAQVLKTAKRLSETTVTLPSKELERIQQGVTTVIPIDGIYASDLSRAQETARVIQEHQKTSVPFHTVANLREQNYGELENTSVHTDVFLGLLRKWNNGDLDSRAPGGESPREVIHRGVEAVSDILEAVEEQHGAIVVAHCGIILTLIEHFTKQQIILENAGFAVVGFEEKNEKAKLFLQRYKAAVFDSAQ